MNLLDSAGFYGMFIMATINGFALWKQQTYLIYYFVFLFLNNILNQTIKVLVKQPRPTGYKELKDMDHANYTGVHLYGMPSGHSQSVFFSLTFLWCVVRSVPLFILGLFICAITLYQRWKYKKHSIEQLAVGAFVGSCFGYFVYYFVKTNLKNVLSRNLIL